MIDKRVGAYVGIDPTAPSLHVGHLVPLMALFWMYIHGFHVVALVSYGSNVRRTCLIIFSWEVLRQGSEIRRGEAQHEKCKIQWTGKSTWLACTCR